MRFAWLAALTLALLPAEPAQAGAAPLVGKVTRVRDGDTIEVAGVSVRLQGVAVPEHDHALGRKAIAAMREFVLGRQVTCHPDGTRSFGRVVAVCTLNGVDLGAYLVRRGLARDCPRFSNGRYQRLEASLKGNAPIFHLYRLPRSCLRRGQNQVTRR